MQTCPMQSWREVRLEYDFVAQEEGGELKTRFGVQQKCLTKEREDDGEEREKKEAQSWCLVTCK